MWLVHFTRPSTAWWKSHTFSLLLNNNILKCCNCVKKTCLAVLTWCLGKKNQIKIFCPRSRWGSPQRSTRPPAGGGLAASWDIRRETTVALKASSFGRLASHSRIFISGAWRVCKTESEFYRLKHAGMHAVLFTDTLVWRSIWPINTCSSYCQRFCFVRLSWSCCGVEGQFNKTRKW